VLNGALRSPALLARANQSSASPPSGPRSPGIDIGRIMRYEYGKSVNSYYGNKVRAERGKPCLGDLFVFRRSASAATILRATVRLSAFFFGSCTAALWPKRTTAPSASPQAITFQSLIPHSRQRGVQVRCGSAGPEPPLSRGYDNSIVETGTRRDARRGIPAKASRMAGFSSRRVCPA
jgi:hypothetical protein